MFYTNSTFCDRHEEVIEVREEFFAIAQSTDVIIMTCLLSVSGFIGLIGNSIVILMCVLYPSTQSTQSFILAMAVSDLVVCCAIIPYRIISYHLLITEAACKLFEALTYCSVHFSGCILIAVAFERYYAVCKPLTFCCNPTRAKYVIISLCCVCVTFSITAGLVAGHYIVLVEDDNKVNVCFTGICIEDGQDTRLVDEEGILIYSQVMAVFYLLMVPTVTVLYGNVFWVLHKRYGLHVKRISNSSVSPQDLQSREMDVVEESDIKIYSIEVDSNGSQVKESKKRINAQKQAYYVKARTSKKYLYHKRAATILLLVTVGFVVTYIPFFLMKLKLVENIVTIRLSFFLSSMINPLIYSFTNQKFRDNIRRTMPLLEQF